MVNFKEWCKKPFFFVSLEWQKRWVKIVKQGVTLYFVGIIVGIKKNLKNKYNKINMLLNVFVVRHYLGLSVIVRQPLIFLGFKPFSYLWQSVIIYCYP
ncbi:hypothetical protein AAX11_06175 [Moraxella bovoculi]|nr:hypothetical protein AAX11_06175 [Moraxella bovoculi]